MKQGGVWQEVEWQTALDFVAHGLRNIMHEHGADRSPPSRTAALDARRAVLLQKLMRGLGSGNVDFRLRQTRLRADGQVTPWLGMPIAELSKLDRALVIGCFLRKDHPLVATRLRAAVKKGAKLSIVHAVGRRLLIPVADKTIAAPTDWLAALAEIVAAVAGAKGVAAPAGSRTSKPARPQGDCRSLNAGEARTPACPPRQLALHHPQASKLHAPRRGSPS